MVPDTGDPYLAVLFSVPTGIEKETWTCGELDGKTLLTTLEPWILDSLISLIFGFWIMN
jgi:hypothetical protein